MTRAGLSLLALLASLPGALYAQQVPNPMSNDGANAKNPEAMTKLLSDGALIGGTVNFSTGLKPRIHAYGTTTGTITGPANIYANYLFNADTDNADCSSMGGCYNVYAGTSFGGSTLKGNRNGIYAFLHLASPTGNAGPGTFGYGDYYTALIGESRASSSDNGTPGAQHGNIFAGNLISRLEPAATDMASMIGLEIDMEAQVGSSVGYKYGLTVVQTGVDKVRGGAGDTAIGIGNQAASTGTTGWGRAISIGMETGYWPMHPAGTLIGTVGGLGGGAFRSAGQGIDFSEVNFQGAAFRSQGFAVNDKGELMLARAGVVPAAPGAFFGKLVFVCSATAGKLKLLAYGGTDVNPVVIADNIGSGASGC